MEQLQELYRQWSGAPAARVEKLPGAGSNRSYYRLAAADGTTVIGCVGTSREENHAFVTLARHFASKGLPVPQVLAVSADEVRYLQTDLGATSLFDAIKAGREAGGNYSEAEKELLRQTIRLLPRMQFEGGRGLDFSVCYPQPAFDQTGVMFDLNYFKYCYLKATGVDFHELRLEEDFRWLAADLMAPSNLQAPSNLPPKGEASEVSSAAREASPFGGRLEGAGGSFLYRDFQARNVMLAPTPCFIDFQGGRKGPFYYDLASFLWQASARYPQDLRRELLDVYYAEAQHYTVMPTRDEFDSRLRLFVFFRLLQVLGAYGFRGYFERKQHFIDSIPPALDNLRQLLADGSFGYPELEQALGKLKAPSNLPPKGEASKATSPAGLSSPFGGRLEGAPLIVRIFSFSYKKGIPQDESGNGGGYVFDCRGTNNPGRYEQYKQLTGLDQPVIKFLEDDGEILTFLESVYKLADAHVKRYVERGFTSLMFSFGCTGGQHRSVYSAQHLAEHIHRHFPGVEVRLCHREQGITQTFPKI